MTETACRQKITIESIFRCQAEIRDEIIERRRLISKVLTLSFIIILSSAVYGFTMGIRHSFPQALCSMFKVPTLFYATLLICFPTLHFIGLLFGSRVRYGQSLTVLLLGLAVTGVLLAAFSPISIFFLLTGSRYASMMILHVLIFTFCGAAGLLTIRRNLVRLRAAIPHEENYASRYLLQVWMALYMFVGTQMAYVLAPYVGKETTFILFREATGNFYSYMWDLLKEVLH